VTGKRATALATANALLANGEWGKAVAAFRRILRGDPHDAAALRGLGMAALRKGEHAEALKALEACRQVSPRDAEVHFLLGNLYLGAGRMQAAVDVYRIAAALAPAVAEIFNNLGAALVELGQPSAAIEPLRRAVALKPGLAEAHNSLGNALSRLDQGEEAERSYAAAIQANPNLIHARINRGHLLIDLGRTAEALAEFSAALASEPGNDDAMNGRGLALQKEGRHDEAIEVFRRAIARNAGNASAIGNLAVSLQAQGRHEDALARGREAHALRPEAIDIQVNLGHILQSLGRHAEAATMFVEVLGRDPARLDVAPYLLHSRLHLCDWSDLERLEAMTIEAATRCDGTGRGSTVPPFALAATSASPDLRLKVARHSAAAHARQVAGLARTTLREAHDEDPDRALRIGYVSPDFRTHSVAIAFRGLLAAHDRERFEWFGYSLSSDPPDALGRELEAAFHRFRDVSRLSVADAANAIAEDRIDVLIDLAGHTRGTRLELFALTPAPVQAHYLGYGATVGADYIPWLITDRIHTPPALVPHCSERLVYLPHTFMAATPATIDKAPVSRRDEGLPDHGIVFANFNAHYKFDPATFAIWMRVMAGHPESVLWLRAGHETAMANLRRAAEASGVAGDRLVFARRLDHPRHLARHRLADLALDTRFHTGGVTTLDALWAGLPVVTLAGAAHSERTGASILQALGVPELIAASSAAYEQLIADLAADAGRRRTLAEAIDAKRRNTPLFDPRRLARDLETAYRALWRGWVNGDTSREIRIAP